MDRGPKDALHNQKEVRMHRASVVGLSILLVAATAMAQDVASVSGVVRDASGAPVAGAVVVFHIQSAPGTNGGCGGCGGNGGSGNGPNGQGSWTVVSAVTDETGSYLIPELPVGSGWAKASKPGLGISYQTVNLTAGANVVDFQLRCGRRQGPQPN